MADKEHRVTITFPNKDRFDQIAAYAKKHKLTQGEVIEVLLETVYDEHFLLEGLDKRREQKVASRTSVRSIIQRTKGLGAEVRKAQLKKANSK